MTIPLRPLALAAVFGATLFAGSAAAQTVMARSAPAGEKVEVFLNGKAVGTATAGPTGDATIPVNMQANLGKTEMDANIYVDGCEKTHRIWIVEVGRPAPSEGTCNLKTVSAVFWVRPVNTIVVDVAAVIPRVLLVKGSYTPPAPGEEGKPAPSRVLPGGISVFGGSGYLKTNKAVSTNCGNVSGCTGDESGFPITVGAEYRFGRFLSAEASYIKPPEATTSGSSTSYRFTSSRKIDAYTLAGKVGIPAGPARIYGKAGAIYNQAKSVTTQTQDDVVLTVDEVQQTLKGGTQSLELKTDGWSWLIGGGFEVWPSSRIAFYGEVNHAKLTGSDLGGGEGRLDESFTAVFAGLRIHLFK